MSPRHINKSFPPAITGKLLTLILTSAVSEQVLAPVIITLYIEDVEGQMVGLFTFVLLMKSVLSQM